MTRHPVARVYTEALYEIAREKSMVEEAGGELEQVRDLLEKESQFSLFLDSPLLETKTKLDLLHRALSGNVSDLILDFMSLLLEKGRFGALPSIAEAYREIADAHAGRSRVQVTSAKPLSDALRQEIRTTVSRALGREIVLQDRVEPALVGGAVITIGDTVYDGSLATRLSKSKKQIMRSGGYEDQG